MEEGTGLAGWSKYRRYAAAAVAVVLAGGVVVIMLTTVARSASAGFLHIRLNLSATSDYTSADPALAISPDHDWVAVAWVEGYIQSKTDSRGHVYLRAASESAGRFGNRIAVYTGDGSACAFDRAAVAVTGTTAHIAYTVYYNTCSTPQYTRLYYQTCSLTSGTCGSSELITSTATSQYQITWVDLAVDENGDPHVVFARYGGAPLEGEIFYAARTGGAWGNSESVYGTGDNNTPAIAWGGGCAHVAWQSEGETLSRIIYKRRCTGVWGAEIHLYSAAVNTNPPHRPDVAARSGRVFVVWGFRYRTNPETYALLYIRSNNNGESFPVGGWREVVTDYDASRYSDFTEYTPGGAEATYLEHLQPSIDLNDDGWPAVVWHTGGVTGTYYSYAITGTTNNVDWNGATPTLLVESSSGAASVGFGEPISETVPLLHFTYMEMTDSAWDVYYDSSQEYDTPPVYLPLVLKNN